MILSYKIIEIKWNKIRLDKHIADLYIFFQSQDKDTNKFLQNLEDIQDEIDLITYAKLVQPSIISFFK